MGSGFPCGSVIKNLPANAGDMGSIPGSGRSLGEGNGNPLQYSCLGSPIGHRSLAGYSPWAHKGVGHDVVIKQHQKPCCGGCNSRRKDEGERINRVSAD